MDGKILVVYFSCTGTTKALAEYASDVLGADLYEITPEEPYTDEDLAYYTGGRADREQDDPDARPGISGNVSDMAVYETIVLGFPLWHGQAPRIISTFLESYDFAGKTIVPFVPHTAVGLERVQMIFILSAVMKQNGKRECGLAAELQKKL